MSDQSSYQGAFVKTPVKTFFIREIEKAIKELGLKQIFLLTDSNVPAYEFYKKNGFVECETNVAFAKMI